MYKFSNSKLNVASAFSIGFNYSLIVSALSILSACGGGIGGSDIASGSPNTAPTQLALKEVSSNKVGVIDVNWQPAIDDSTPSTAIKYQVHISTNPTFTPSLSTLVFEGSNLLSTSVTSGIVPGATHAVRLVAIDQDGASSISDVKLVNVATSSGKGSSLGSIYYSYGVIESYPITDCVKDNITGLTWEGKTSSGFRSGNNVYTNFGDGRPGDSSAYVAAVNVSALCGFTDWQMPDVFMMRTLMNLNAYPLPIFDPKWLPNNDSLWY